MSGHSEGVGSAKEKHKMLRGNECNAVPHQARAAYRFPWPSLALLSTDRNWLMLVMNRSADTVSAKILTQDHASNTGTRTPSQAVLRPSLVRSFVFFLELMQRKPPMLVGSLQHSWRRPPGSAAIGAELASCFTLVQEAYSRFAETETSCLAVQTYAILRRASAEN